MFKLNYYFCGIFVSGFIFRFLKSKDIKFSIKVRKNIFMKAFDRSIIRRYAKVFLSKQLILIEYCFFVLLLDCFNTHTFLFL